MFVLGFNICGDLPCNQILIACRSAGMASWPTAISTHGILCHSTQRHAGSRATRLSTGQRLLDRLHPRYRCRVVDAHDLLRQQILGQFYPCIGAISAFNQKTYRFGLYPEFASEGAVRAVCHDLYCFLHEFPSVDNRFITFISMFRGPSIESEQHFEDLLWTQLQAMHFVDSDFFAWDTSVVDDPASHHFSYSVGGRAMYVIGMHPKASRLARTRPYPTMVFNLHQQFERLRALGKFETMKHTIRAREMINQGSINPMLTSFGENSEARQYSGRAVPTDWSCPFHPRRQDTT